MSKARENLRFDKRVLERNLRSGALNVKDIEGHLGALPDVSDKIAPPPEDTDLELEDQASEEAEASS